MRSHFLAGLMLATLCSPSATADPFGLSPDFTGLAATADEPGDPPQAAPVAADDLTVAEGLVEQAWASYWAAISSKISRVQCGRKAKWDRGDEPCKYTVGGESLMASAEKERYQERVELLQDSEEALDDAGSRLASLVGAALDRAAPEPTDASITRTGRLVAALKSYNDLVDRATRTELVRDMNLWFDTRTRTFEDPLPRFDIQGLVAHVEPAAFAGGTPSAGRGEVDALVESLRTSLEALREPGQAYGDATILDLHHQYRAAKGVSRDEIVEASARYEAGVTALAPVVARLRYELEARGLAEESRDPWRTIGGWEMRVNSTHSYWVTWTRLVGYRSAREDAQVVWHMFPPLYDAADQEQHEKITDRWMPFGRDNGSVMTLGQQRPTRSTPPSS